MKKILLILALFIGCNNALAQDVEVIPDYCQHPVYGYLDFRCWKPIQAECPANDPYDWSCPVPYDHRYIQIVSGKIRGAYNVDECSDHYRAARYTIGELYQRITALENQLKEKCEKKKK